MRDRQAAQVRDGSGRHAAEEVTRIATHSPCGRTADETVVL